MKRRMALRDVAYRIYDRKSGTYIQNGRVFWNVGNVKTHVIGKHDDAFYADCEVHAFDVVRQDSPPIAIADFIEERKANEAKAREARRQQIVADEEARRRRLYESLKAHFEPDA